MNLREAARRFKHAVVPTALRLAPRRTDLPLSHWGLARGSSGALTLHETGDEPLFTMVGVGILALGHRLNFLAAD